MGRSILVALLALSACASEPSHGPRATAPGRERTATAAPATLIDAAEPAPPYREPSTAPDSITLAAVGDVMLARTIGDRLERESPFAAVASILRDADVAVANLECAIGSGGAPAKKAFTFRAPPLAAAALGITGIDVVSLANNHALDFGPDTFKETLALLDRANVAHTGAGLTETDAHRATTLDVRGHKLAFLGYAKVPVEGLGGFDTATWEAKGERPGIAWADPVRIAKDVAEAKASAEHVIVFLHSGFEMAQTPNIWQTAAAESAIDAGATLVLGTHPHVLQGAKRHKHGFIAYSLGNFVFDRTDTYSAILRVTLDASGVKDVEWVPVFLRDGYPELTDETTATFVRNILKGLSMPLGG